MFFKFFCLPLLTENETNQNGTPTVEIGFTFMKAFELLDLLNRNGFAIVHTSDNKIKIIRGGLFRVFANIEAAYNYYFGICL